MFGAWFAVRAERRTYAAATPMVTTSGYSNPRVCGLL